MVDAHALGACGLGRAGSNPASPTSGVEVDANELKVIQRSSCRSYRDVSQTIGL